MRVLAVVPTLNESIERTIQSIKRQTHPISAIGVVSAKGPLTEGVDLAVVCQPNLGECVGRRVAKALNFLLQNVTLGDYHYILRVDSDVVLPPNFVEANLSIHGDIVGTCGYAMLIRVEPFVDNFAGRFPEVCADDSYLAQYSMSIGLNVVQWKVRPVLLRRSGAHQNWRYFYDRGLEMHRMGYEPLHVLFICFAETLRHDWRNLYSLPAYLFAKLTHDPQYTIAKWVWRRQVRRLISLK